MGIVHIYQSTERRSLVEDFCAEYVEPAPELSAKSRTRALALVKYGK